MADNYLTVDIEGGKGGIEKLHITEIPRPSIDHAKALVKVKAFGLNRMDLLQREGMYPVPPQAPKTLGVEFSGTIEELASESEGSFKKGDAVFGLAYGGAYAEYIAVSTHMLVHKPDELSWEECAGIPEVSRWAFRRHESASWRSLTSVTDMDHCTTSHVSRRRVCTGQVDLVACRRICSLHRRSAAKYRKRCLRSLCHCSARREMRLLRERARRQSGVQHRND